jgi:hypothetical protein
LLRGRTDCVEEESIRLVFVLGSSIAGFLLGGPVVAIVAAAVAPIGLLLVRSLRAPSVVRDDRAGR